MPDQHVKTDQRVRALELFQDKWPLVQRILTFHADGFGIFGPDREDLVQTAALALWENAMRCAPGPGLDIHCGLICKRAWHQWKSTRPRLRMPAVSQLKREDGRPIERAARPPAAIRVHDDDGAATVTLAEVQAFEPELLARHRDGLTMAEAARRLGVTAARVQQIRKRLGAVRVIGDKGRHQWRIPAELLTVRAGSPG